MNLTTTIFTLSALTLMTAFTAIAGPEPVIYGTITESDGTKHTGTIRWGQQESHLSDIFNGTRLTPTGLTLLSEDEKEQLLDHQPGPQAQIGDIQITFKSFFGKELDPPDFNVFFGSLNTVEKKDDVITATLHDGSKIKSSEGSNDLTDEIYLTTSQGEVKEFELDEIQRITLSKAPPNARTFAAAIYGSVTSSIGTYTGRVMWDKDERTVDEELDGNDESQEYEIKFIDIVSIEKTASGEKSIVTLKDGNVLTIGGTNDVNSGNRGIWIDHPDTGRVEVNWTQFVKFERHDVEVNWMNFDDYQNSSKKLNGTVVLIDGSTVQASELIYDMNMQSSSELLLADINGGNRQVPLAKFKAITRLNEQGAELTLLNQQKLKAYNSRNVSRDNNGLLVTDLSGSTKWYPWVQIKSITFD